MAKRTCARKTPRARKRAYTHAHLAASRRHRYTPELLANGRHRYEQTDERLVMIAADFGVNTSTLTRLARRLGWVRYVAPARDLPRAVKLATQAEQLAASTFLPRSAVLQPPPERGRSPAEAELRRAGGGLFETETTPTLTLPLSGGGNGGALAGGGEADASAPRPDKPALPTVHETAAELYAAVLEELAAVKAMRAQLKRQPQRPLDAMNTARTLASLTDTLNKLQRVQCAVPQTGQSHDDMPADIDEFRNELARRIRAFVASRRKPDGADGAPAAPVGKI